MTHEELVALVHKEVPEGAEEMRLLQELETNPHLAAELQELELLGEELRTVFRSEESARLEPEREAAIRLLGSRRQAGLHSVRPWMQVAAVLAVTAFSVYALLSRRTEPPTAPVVALASTEMTVAIPEADLVFPEVSDIEAETPLKQEEVVLELPDEPIPSLTLVPPTEPKNAPEEPYLKIPGSERAPLTATSTVSRGAKSVGSLNARVSGSLGLSEGSATRSLHLTSEGREADRNKEAYAPTQDSGRRAPTQAPLSTFSIDVDTASYTNLRRYILSGSLPPKDAVRIEEMLNYFRYAYPSPPKGGPTIALQNTITECPWNKDHRLARIALQASDIDPEKRPALNLVFLVDVSGSMTDENKLPLVKKSLEILVAQLRSEDRLAIVTYAGVSRVALQSTRNKVEMLEAIQGLNPGGSTNGASGIQLAYEQALKHHGEGASRVLLCTDGDFNVGAQSQEELKSLIQEKAKSGVLLNVFGFGMGNLKDNTLETLSQNGNGTYGYIDSLEEARRVFETEINGTLFTMARDVKVQVEFNPEKVASYRLVGYENRRLRNADFRNDAKDAGELGAGQSVTALYEIEPVEVSLPDANLRYPANREKQSASLSQEILNVNLRYLDELSGKRVETAAPLLDTGKAFAESDHDFRLAAGVAMFGMLLRNSEFKGESSYSAVEQLVRGAQEAAPSAATILQRTELRHLVKKASELQRD